MATKRFTRKKLEKDLSVQLVNCRSILKTPLLKYMTASRVLAILENNPHQIGFVSPEKWYDPYETKYLKTDYTGLGYKQPDIFCFCVRMDNTNEEASWKIYKRENEPLLRLSIDTFGFLSKISDFASKNECDVYFAKVDYRLKATEIDTLYKTSSPYYHIYFNSFDDKQYVKVMSLKRRAFSYEKEYRIFIIPKNKVKVKKYIKDGVLNIPIDVNMISKFTFSPAEKSDNSLSSQIKQVKTEAEKKFLKERIKTSYPEAKTYISTLYSSVKVVEKIE